MDRPTTPIWITNWLGMRAITQRTKTQVLRPWLAVPHPASIRLAMAKPPGDTFRTTILGQLEALRTLLGRFWEDGGDFECGLAYNLLPTYYRQSDADELRSTGGFESLAVHINQIEQAFQLGARRRPDRIFNGEIEGEGDNSAAELAPHVPITPFAFPRPDYYLPLYWNSKAAKHPVSLRWQYELAPRRLSTMVEPAYDLTAAPGHAETMTQRNFPRNSVSQLWEYLEFAGSDRVLLYSPPSHEVELVDAFHARYDEGADG